MVVIRPSLLLKMDLDERLVGEDSEASIKRCYSYVGPTQVSTHEPDPEAGDRVDNTLRFVVKMHRPYWDPSNKVAEDLWRNNLPKWLRNTFSKVSNTITACNKDYEEAGKNRLDFTWFEVEFGTNVTVAFKSTGSSTLPSDAVPTINRIRTLMAEGAFGEDVATISIPSKASYAAQLAQAEQAAAEEASAEEDAQEETTEPVAAPAVEEVAVDVQEGEPTADEAAAEEQAEAPFVPATLPAFDVDYTLWGVEYADGSVREYNEAEGAFAE